MLSFDARDLTHTRTYTHAHSDTIRLFSAVLPKGQSKSEGERGQRKETTEVTLAGIGTRSRRGSVFIQSAAPLMLMGDRGGGADLPSPPTKTIGLITDRDKTHRGVIQSGNTRANTPALWNYPPSSALLPYLFFSFSLKDSSRTMYFPSDRAKGINTREKIEADKELKRSKFRLHLSIAFMSCVSLCAECCFEYSRRINTISRYADK